ncbi:glycosyltransferase family 9 protein [Antribacter gilvus]|uniref:glycosyltransferase family 9 protein n=1 Tax=Antribacter gilvus TaxID=2304675 RepID=UPI0019800019|nr:glycosyltransferase family 9 protein [Antribacter gilvus]
MTVLVLRALGLGDALTGVAALRGIRRAWPGHRVVLAAPQAIGDWLTDLGIVDAVVPARGLEPLPWPWAGPGGSQDAPGSIAVNLHGSGPESHRVLLGTRPSAFVAFANAEVGNEGPDWDESEHEVLRWCRLVASRGGRCGPGDLRLGPADPAGGRDDHVVVHPGAAAPARRWPPERWAQVVAHLAGQGHHVVLTGSAAERELCTRVRQTVVGPWLEPSGHPPASARGVVSDASGRLDLPTLADVVGTARLLVSADTGVAHVATAYGTPSVTLFGPTPPSTWGPVIDLPRHAVIWHGEPGDPLRDPNGTTLDPALADVTVDEVVAACDAVVGRAAAR